MNSVSRRDFLRQAAQGTGALVLAAGTLSSVAKNATNTPASKDANPFAYDVDRFAKTNPALVRYERVLQFATPADPRRICADSSGKLYVAAKNGVSVFDGDGAKLGEIALSEQARCVAVAPDGVVYAGLRDHVEVFDAKWHRQASWETPAKKTWFTGLAVGLNDVFAADSANRVVLRYDRSGKLVGKIGLKDKDRNVPGLIVPSPYLDVALGQDGLLRVTNPGRHRVEIYSANGDLELFWGVPSAAIEGFCGCCNPVAIEPLSAGLWLTCEKGLPRVKAYDEKGGFQFVIAGPELFPENTKTGSSHDVTDGVLGGLDVAAGGQGRVYVLDLVGGQVSVMKPKAA